MTPAAEDQLRALADRVATQQQVIEAMAGRLSERIPDPTGLRSALEAIQSSRAYRLARILDRLSAPLRLAKRALRHVLATVRSRRVPQPRTDQSTVGLRVQLERELPKVLAVGRGNHLTFVGWCYHPASPVAGLRITRDGQPLATPVFRILRPDVHAAQLRDDDPAGYSLISGFSVTVELPACDCAASATFGVEARLADGSVERADLAEVVLRPDVDAGAAAPDVPPARPGDPPLVAICMATYDPPAHLFERQVASILAQTLANWICIVTDDGSPPEAFARVAALADRDPRFRVYRNPTRLGFYHNFERCLALVPEGAEFVALSDHDDDWRPDKLATLLAKFDSETTLVYSDMRIVTAEGECLSETYWTTRRNNHTNLVSLLVANTVTGAASLFRRRLLAHILPFPDRHGNVYHDQWIGAVALALGKVGYVDRPVYDYVQHGRNVIGHCAPAPVSRWQRLKAIWASLRPAGPRAWVDRLAIYGPMHDVRYDPARQFARLLLHRCGPNLAQRRSLRWLAGADRSFWAWLWLAGRGMWHHPVTIGAEYEMLATFFWRASSQSRIRARLRRAEREPVPAPPPPTSVYGWLPHRVARLKLLASPAVPRRVNLLLSVVDFKHVFGGYIAVFHLARRLAESGRRVRMVTTDECRYEPEVWREKFRAYPGLEDFLDRVEVVAAHDRAIPLEVHPHDQFLASSWWTAHVAHKAAVELGRRSFVYLSQDYEPVFYPMGSTAALARESYTFPHHAIFSTELLRDYFRQNGHGVYASGREVGDRASVAFENAITPVGPVHPADLAGRSPRKVLFYARPEPYNARNLFELGVMALVKGIRSGVFIGEWEFYGIGSSTLTGRVELADGMNLRLLPRQNLAEYGRTLKTHDVGLSLMDTPHPSLVPLEMASAGMLTVTNTFANKTAERLREISPNLIAVEPTAPALVAGLRRAVAGVEDCEARAGGARLQWSTDWETSFPPSMMRTIGEFLDAGDPQGGMREAA
jgi:glycosyltransferase involved in cell wall biosynthesis